MRYSVRHETRYAYGAPVEIGQHLLRLTPREIAGQSVLAHALSITPEPARIHAFVDHFGNLVHHVAVETAHAQLAVTLDATLSVTRAAMAAEGPAWETVRDAMRGDGFPAHPSVAEFVDPSPLAAPDDGATAYAADSFAAGRPMVAALVELTRRLHEDFAYTVNQTSVSTRVAEVMATRRGVCQDFAHVMIAGLRGLGLPARYVSGYIHTRPAGEAAVRAGSDASHAWVSAWCGEPIGWVELDPTNDLVVADEHIVVAYGRDFSDASPLRGVILGGGSHALEVAVRVEALDAAEGPVPVP